MKTLMLSLLITLLICTAVRGESFTLEQCIDTGRNRNLDLKRSESTLVISTLKTTQARDNYYPRIYSGATFSNRTWSDGIIEEYHPWFIEMVQPLCHFGEFGYKLKQNEASRLASLLDLLETNIVLEKDITIAYLKVLKAKKQKALAVNIKDYAIRQRDRIAALVEKNTKGPRALDRWQVLIDSFNDEEIKYENELAIAYTELRKLMEWEDSSKVIEVLPFEITEDYDYDHSQMEEIGRQFTPVQFENILFSYAATFCPAIKRRTFDVIAAENAVSYERALNMPAVDLVPHYEHEDVTTRTTWQLGLRAKFNFLNLPDWEIVAIRNEELNRTCIERDIFYRDRKSGSENFWTKRFTEGSRWITWLLPAHWRAYQPHLAHA